MINKKDPRRTKHSTGAGKAGANDETRTRYLHHGKVALYQMSYIRKFVKRTSNIITRTAETVNPVVRIFVKIFIFYSFPRYVIMEEIQNNDKKAI